MFSSHGNYTPESSQINIEKVLTNIVFDLVSVISTVTNLRRLAAKNYADIE